ncbi:putative methyltransferase-domain-containing protein [Phellopilus nigrolimitatus]|nr:putative methyltransferase-domain-containing protein [Phellopilus nigrolimitatus]
MFYYIHFTRPPPEQAFLSHSLRIAPNIANDLRTEFPKTNEGIDIYYAWVKASENSRKSASTSAAGASRALGPMTPPLKLMTCKGETYEKVPVFPPKDAREGERWQLLLCTKPARLGKHATSVDLSPPSSRSSKDFDTQYERDAEWSDFGAHVFPILSEPVLFRKGAPGKTLAEKKQVQNERILKFPSLWGTSVGPLRITEHLSYDLDKKVWDSGMGLSHWLVSTMVGALDAPPIIRSLMDSKSPTILELGAGTGLVSLVLSALLSHHPEMSSPKVIATDLASAMEVLGNNITANDHWLPTVRPKAVVLDWDDETLPVEVQEGVDFIIMADVTYNTDSFPALIGTLSRLSRSRKGLARQTNQAVQPPQLPETTALLAYKERDPDERRLWDMALAIGLRLDEVARVRGAGGHPVEIYAGTFQPS